MVARLSELLTPVEALERLQAAIAAGAGVPVMHTYASIGVPGLPNGGVPGVPGGGLPGGGGTVPGLPGIGGEGDPEGPQIPPLGHGTWPGGPRSPIGGDPTDIDSLVELLATLFPRPGKSAKVPCGLQVLIATKMLQKSVPAYELISINPVQACAGQAVTLRGHNFGPPGKVVFAGGQPGCEVPATMWSATAITAVVPAAAKSGLVTLKSKIGTVRACGNDIDVFQLGDSIEFDGGAPNILSLTVNGRATDAWALPGPATVEVNLPISNPTNVTITVLLNGVSTSSVVLLWPATHSTTVTIPDARWATVQASYSNSCGTATASINCWVGSPGTLDVLGLELTQGIQVFKQASEGWKSADRRLWNSLPLIEGKPTVVRVFVAVAYDTSRWQTFAITGWLDLFDATTGKRVGATLSPLQRNAAGAVVNGVQINVGQFSLVDRNSSTASLNFLIPEGWSAGHLHAVFTGVVIDGYQKGATVTASVTGTWRTKSSLNVHYVQVTGKEGGSRPPLGDLATRQFVTEGLNVLPFPVLRVAPAPEPIINSDEIWTAHDGDDRLLDQLVDLSDNEDDTRYVGVVNWPPVATGISGRTTHCETTSWATREKIVIAHELGHQLCLNHVAGWSDDDSLDTLPNNGYLSNTPFDPTALATVTDLANSTSLLDFMIPRVAVTGAPVRPIYISEANWQRLADTNPPW